MIAEGPLADIGQEADRLLALAEAGDVEIRLLGGLAVRDLARDVPDALRRTCQDIDFMARKGRGRAVSALLVAAGYDAAREFNAVNGHRRLLFHDEGHARQIDVFVGTFAMCHAIPVGDRLLAHARTLPPAELLLTKLQVVHLTDKDFRDAVALLLTHEVAGRDEGAVNAAVVARLAAADWGLWRTTQLNLDRIDDGVGDVGLDPGARDLVVARVAELRAAIAAEPKNAKWRMRDRLGDRKRWYEDPEEVG